MDACFVSLSGQNFCPDPEENVLDSIFQQYEKVIVESLISSFGLDFLIKDQYGGDVDTINNVRKIGTDSEIHYKNIANEADYDNRGTYDKKMKAAYDSDKRFVDFSAEMTRRKEAGNLQDAYTGKTFPKNGYMDIDHIKSTKEIHEDRGRILAELSGIDLANSEENLAPTERSINRSMKEKSIDEYCEWLDQHSEERKAKIKELKNKTELSDKEKKLLNKFEQQEAIDQDKMKARDRIARKSYEAKLARAYYTSPKFAKDTAIAAGKVGLQMGIRQVTGLIFTEVWFSVKEEFQRADAPFSMEEFFNHIGRSVKRGFENAKWRYKELLSRFRDGAIAGALSSLTTTICNIFFTTAKNIVKIIRQTYASLVEAAKILFLNPDNLPFGERMRATVKIISTGASVVVGTMLNETLQQSPIAAIPVIGDIVPAFCGTLVTGILSCTLLYYLDRSETMNRLVSVLNNLPSVSSDVDYFKKQAAYFEMYAAQLAQIDIEAFHKETTEFKQIADEIGLATTTEELNCFLLSMFKRLGLKTPWEENFDNFNSFMLDENSRLVFE